jgi:integrase
MVIHARSGKGRKDRYVMLSEQLLGILRAYCKCAGPQHFLFPGIDPARPITVRSLQRACRVAADIARAEDAGVGFQLLPLLRDFFAKCGGCCSEKRFKISRLRNPY